MTVQQSRPERIWKLSHIILQRFPFKAAFVITALACICLDNLHWFFNAENIFENILCNKYIKSFGVIYILRVFLEEIFERLNDLVKNVIQIANKFSNLLFNIDCNWSFRIIFNGLIKYKSGNLHFFHTYFRTFLNVKCWKEKVACRILKYFAVDITTFHCLLWHWWGSKVKILNVQPYYESLKVYYAA